MKKSEFNQYVRQLKKEHNQLLVLCKNPNRPYDIIPQISEIRKLLHEMEYCLLD